MGHAIKNVATVAVTLALGSVLVACGGGQSGSNSTQGSGGGTGSSASVVGEWVAPCEDNRSQNLSQQASFTLFQTAASELGTVFYVADYAELGCKGVPIARPAISSTLILQPEGGAVVTVKDVGVTPRKVKIDHPNSTTLGLIALQDAQHLGYLESAPSMDPSYPPPGSSLSVYTRVVTP